jgi:hypothetical protein
MIIVGRGWGDPEDWQDEEDDDTEDDIFDPDHWFWNTFNNIDEEEEDDG